MTFAAADQEEIEEGVRKLAKAIREEFGMETTRQRNGVIEDNTTFWQSPESTDPRKLMER